MHDLQRLAGGTPLLIAHLVGRCLRELLPWLSLRPAQSVLMLRVPVELDTCHMLGRLRSGSGGGSEADVIEPLNFRGSPDSAAAHEDSRRASSSVRTITGLCIAIP